MHKTGVKLPDPKVSICIPAYKQPDYLRRALQSVVMQAYEDYEVIVTDDSPDESIVKVVSEFHQYPKLRYFKNKERKGSPENWNEAISFASGTYVKMLHHDDWFADKYSLQRFVKMLDDNENADFGFSSTYACDATQRIKYLHHPTEAQLERLKKNPIILFTGNFIGSPSTTIYRKKVNLVFDKKLKWVVDIDFYIDVLKKNPNFIYLSEPLIFTTSGAAHQVTSESAENREIEVFEWMYLYNKISTLYRADYTMLKAIWNLTKKYEVTSTGELLQLGIEPPIPPSVKMLLFLNKLLRS